MDEVDVDPFDRMRRANFEKAEHEVAKAAESLFLEMSQDGGVDNFFSVVKQTPKLADLPPMYPFNSFLYCLFLHYCLKQVRYQTFVRKVGKMMALNIEKNYANDEQVSKLKRIYRLTPMKGIKGILAVTNPVKVALL